jgi:hypothetical protein
MVDRGVRVIIERSQHVAALVENPDREQEAAMQVIKSETSQTKDVGDRDLRPIGFRRPESRSRPVWADQSGL